ncbi:response regulator [Paenibacillus sp. HWE-109]|uniref:response regulator n=1 Tax=Paenibacillus sp. HWE-109 TaxID=1306526 RepID=UPI001EDD6FB8|nr:response regulator [Paenibacillus sp. HWE-109]UKS26784.1 response regulator [Paenibacillus sp. HWE-109]
MRIMIVDDEEKIRLGLSKLIVKASADYEIIGVYASGAECLEALRDNQPDVVVTDIKMPGMSGLELAKTIHQFYLHIKCVILSGFGEFEYARTAIAAGVSAYLLKPVDKQELYELLAKLQRENTNSQQAAVPVQEDHLLKNRLLGKIVIQADTTSTQQLAWITELSSYCVAVIVTDTVVPRTAFRHWLQLNQPNRIASLELVEMDERTLAMIAVFAVQEEAALHALENHISYILAIEHAFQASVGISCIHSHVEELAEAYRESLDAIEINFYSTERCPLSRAAHSQFGTLHRVESYRKRVLESMEILDVAGMELHLREMLREIGAVKIRMNHLIELVETLFYALHKEAGKRPETANQGAAQWDWGNALKQCFTFGEAKSLIETSLVEGLSLLLNERNVQGAGTIYQIKKIIELEYADSLDLNSLAKRVFLTPSYLSKLFRQETGTTIIEYIISVRMNKAKELLINQMQLKTYQVGELVGYRDPAYFNKQFKKVVGLTPKEFRDVVS